MRHSLLPWVARLISSRSVLILKRWVQEAKRRVLGRPHQLSVFLRVDDPYSYLLLQALPELCQRYRIRLAYYVVSTVPSEMYPEPDLWNKNALADAEYLANLYQFDFPATGDYQTQQTTTQLSNLLLSLQADESFVEKALPLLAQYWRGELTLTNQAANATKLQENEELLASKGHYLSGTIHYAGEWYWGLDRLDHLECRLNKLCAFRGEQTVRYRESSRHYCQRISDLSQYSARSNQQLTIFFSARSPYSYVGLERSIGLAEHYGIAYHIKPVLPMMMRGVNVPPNKKWYIFFDTKREADKLGIDYGFVADPLGEGVERCYALFDYATSEGKGNEFIRTFAQAVNAKGIRSETNAGLRKIVEASGLDWNTALPLLDNQDWRGWAEANFQEMHALGLWGVPCFKYGAVAVWGQDRLDVIEKAICADIKSANSVIDPVSE